MPIELTCTSCGQKLRVSDEHAGRQARCPKCQAISPVPPSDSAGDSPSAVGDKTSASHWAPQSESAQPSGWSSPSSAGSDSGVRWYVKTAEGQQFGPIERNVLDRWIVERRLTSDCQVIEEGAGQWQWAGNVFPQLGGGMAHPASGNPYSSQQYAGAARQSYALQERGALILTLGILGLVLTCPVLGIPAWIMGQGDLNDMRHGRMDPSGKGMTQAGMILGIISTIFSVGCGCLFLVGAVAG